MNKKIVEITDLTEQGQGVARGEDGKVFFIKNGLPQEKVEVAIKKDKKKFALGEATSFLSTSKERQEPFCPHYKICGGCNLQHLKYKSTLEYKSKWIVDTFKKIANLTIKAPTIEGMETPYNYRNKVVFHGKYYKGDYILGFNEKNSNFLFKVKVCHLIPKAFMEIKETLETLCYHHHIFPDDVMIKTNGKDYLLYLNILNSYPYEDMRKLIHSMLEAYPAIKGISHRLQIGAELETITMALNNFNYEVNSKSFFQVNTKEAEVLYDKLEKMIEPLAINTLYDLYCGVGSIGIYLAHKVNQVYGIEAVAESIKMAKKNATLNNIQNIGFHLGNVEISLAYLTDDDSCVLLDPPRGGVEEAVIEHLLTLKPKYILYVGCDLGKAARDIKRFTEDGDYAVSSVDGVDMFPWTGHVETVVLLSKLHTDHHINVTLEMDDLDLTATKISAPWKNVNRVDRKSEIKF
ncbi:hypothetical protein AZF37_05510 [endosymbiont 'TC1' of Trimyema compressum]|uniref:23S rRNA (uracil(1939)-C(5))-methyltransferase RlmD n=1 Tax=endosymbiont 'TC1' of Trimyema compressum TaxID=243899 RepID=UPI0007F1122E|nr:23S rRNA (uracil(1939)-C(5))-methyltransferase RlmD [endosymbiont 'TC1' of Trimyema compressum]AMP20701.1 hypothetical protein AZF37_05510 [endosymbiont 'TC1' of Trimyema compressum]